jgi:hypothetical protein
MLRKHYPITTAVIFLICLLNACSLKDPDRYYSKKDDFSIKIPKDWETKEGAAVFSVISYCPTENSDDQNRSSVFVVVAQSSSDVELDEYFDMCVAKMKGMTDFQYKKGTTSINETDAKWLTYSGRSGTLDLKGKEYYVVRDKRGYAICYAGRPDRYDRYKSAFEEVAHSFEFE